MLSSRTFPLAPVKAAFRLVSQTNPRAQREILKAVLANNPSFALLNAWSELEYQVSKKVRMDRQNSQINRSSRRSAKPSAYRRRA